MAIRKLETMLGKRKRVKPPQQLIDARNSVKRMDMLKILADADFEQVYGIVGNNEMRLSESGAFKKFVRNMDTNNNNHVS